MMPNIMDPNISVLQDPSLRPDVVVESCRDKKIDVIEEEESENLR